MIGTFLGHYEILGHLGAGGMGEVYRARDTHLDRDVAIKVLPEDFATDRERLARFEREAKLLAQLNHPHIATIHGLEEHDGTRFIAMECVDGHTLAEKIEAEGRVDVEEALEIARQIAEALEAAHEAGIIHRDLKPANVKVTPEGQVKVLDFGLAKGFEPDGSSSGISPDLSHSPTMAAATRTGVIMGTAAYMSPEQARGRPVDKRTDIWAFGCVLFEMLTGGRAFDGETVSDVMASILKEEPEWASLPGSTSALTRRLLARCLQKDLARRLHDIADARLDIEDAAEGTGLSSVPGLGGGLPTQPRHQPWRHPVTLAAIAFGAVGVMLAAWFVATRTPAEPADPRPFRLAFSLHGAGQVAVDMDQLLFDVSDDGETIAWIGSVSGSVRQVFYRSVRDLAVRAVPGTEGVVNTWLELSPDGSHVSFLRAGEDGLWAVPLDGSGALQRIFSRNLWSWSWTEDRSFVLAEPYAGLLRLEAPGAEPEILTRLQGDEVTHGFPQVLPGGRAILFSVGIGNFHSTRIEVLTRNGDDSADREVILEDAYSATYVDSGHLVFGRGSQVLAVPFDLGSLSVTGPETTLLSGVETDTRGVVTEIAVSRSGTLVYLPEQGLDDYRLAWADADGRVVWPDIPAAPFLWPRLSPDGSRVAVTSRMGNERAMQIYVVDLDRGVSRRFTSGSRQGNAVWSPTGEELLFDSTRDGHFNLYRAPLTNADAATRMTTSDFDQEPLSWSADGRLAILERLPYDRRRISVLSVADQPSELRVVVEGQADTIGAVSPDGAWLAFVRGGEVFLRGLPAEGQTDGREEQVSRAGGNRPRWHPDGRQLFYVGPDGRSVFAVDVRGGPDLQLGTELLKFVAPEGVEVNLAGGFDVARDGRILLIAREERTAPMEVVVAMNLITRQPHGGSR